MSSNPKPYPSLLFLLYLFLSFHPTQPYTFIYAGCSQDKYQPNSPFESNLNSLLSSFITSSSQSLYNSFTLGTTTTAAAAAPPPPPNQASSIYGLYQCRGDLKLSDCARCIQTSASQIGLVCPNSYGATLQLDSCYLRYEDFDFLGKLDTGLMYKRCSSKSEGNDVEFFSRRDDVLGSLEGGGSGSGGFRVASSGIVQGIGQCLGDLKEEDCKTCVGDVVGKLKSLCGEAAAAHVFLNKCYAMYWASGYYDLNSATDTNGDDDVGKTVAIIVGIVGGLAVLIVLLSVCRKSMG